MTASFPKGLVYETMPVNAGEMRESSTKARENMITANTIGAQRLDYGLISTGVRALALVSSA